MLLVSNLEKDNLVCGGVFFPLVVTERNFLLLIVRILYKCWFT